MEEGGGIGCKWYRVGLEESESFLLQFSMGYTNKLTI